jgi:carboxyl-terminal processing protease
MRLTTQRYYTPSGHAIQADGVHPDIVVESPRAQENALPTLRERDLEGALHSEGSSASARPHIVIDAGAPDAAAAPAMGEARVPGEEVEGHAARGVPFDPEKGSDPVLRIGYEAVRGTLKR